MTNNLFHVKQKQIVSFRFSNVKDTIVTKKQSLHMVKLFRYGKSLNVACWKQSIFDKK